MKHFIPFIIVLMSTLSFGQYDGNTSPEYPELIDIYKKLASEHKEIELYEMGPSDYGLPIYLCIINGAGDMEKSLYKAKKSTTVLINNAIHPGEPDGVNACLIWINEWIENGKNLTGLPLIGIIPAYNVGGMMNRSGNSRANQNGPEEYGFRGNAQNLDLNRDFIKMDSKNMYTFAKIYHALNPDVFMDTHVSNGADYQYTMTYIASIRERMPKHTADLMHEELIPYLHKASSKKGYDLVPYVHTKGSTPETGIVAFNDLPRYAMGYASLLDAISFTLETHMLKPFPQRVQSTKVFLEEVIAWIGKNRDMIEEARNKDFIESMESSSYRYNYSVTEKKDSILFKGYEFSNPISEVTGKPRLKYHQDKPFEKFVPYYGEYEAKDSIEIPSYFVVGGQCGQILKMLKFNDVEMELVEEPKELELMRMHIDHYENSNKPYEGHFLHNKVKVSYTKQKVKLKKGDVLIPMDQANARFIMSVLIPDSPDSYFAWNYFDSYIQQKEYFSPYVFEDKAKELLESDVALQFEFEKRKKENKEFAESTWDQLYFIYKQSPYYEPSHNVLPVFMSVEKR